MKTGTPTSVSLLTVLVLSSVSQSSFAEERFSISIGNNLGLSADTPLKWAENDAQRFDALLNQLCGVSSGRQELLVGKSPQDIQLAFARMRGRVEESNRNGNRTLLLVYYSGHADTDSLHLNEQKVPLQEFKSLIGQIPASTTVTIVDACHSSSLVRGRNKGLSLKPEFDVSFLRESGPEGKVYITSAGTGEVAQESDDLQSAFFTHHLLSGLRGAADRDGDGQITLSEAYRYVYHQTLVSSHGMITAVQHPELDTQLLGEGELVLSQLERAQALLTIPADVQGNLLVIDARSSQVVAEVQKAVGDEIKLAVRSGRYRIQLRSPNENIVRVDEIPLLWSKEHVLKVDAMTSMPLVAAISKGSQENLRPWSVMAGLGVGKPSITSGNVLSFGWLGIQRELAPRWAVRLHLRGGNSTGSNATFQYSNWESELGLGAGAKLEIGAVTIAGWLGGTALLVHQAGERLDAERIRKVYPQASVTTENWTFGGAITLDAECRVALPVNWYLAFQLGGRLSAIKEDGEPALALPYSGMMMVGYEF